MIPRNGFHYLYRFTATTISTFRSSVPGIPALHTFPVLGLVVPTTFSNYIDGDGKGVEPTVAWQQLSRLKLEGTYTYALPRTWVQATAPPGTQPLDTFAPPRNRWTLRSSRNPTGSRCTVRGFFHPFTQTPRCTRIEIDEFAMMLIQACSRRKSV